jgi:hypothetical protein
LNYSIKENYLKRHKEPFGTMKTKVLDIITAYGDPKRTIQQERYHELKHEREAFDFIKAGFTNRSIKFGNQMFVFMGMNGEEVTSYDIRCFQKPRYTSFGQFELESQKVVRVNVSEKNFRLWNCTCKYFFKNNTCKHIIALAQQGNLLTLKPEADTTMMSSRRPAGRPKKNSSALIKD